MRLFWLAGLVYRSVAEMFWWFLVVIVSAVILLGSLRKFLQPKTEIGLPQSKTEEGRRISYWMSQLYLTRTEEGSQKYLNPALVSLVADILVYRERLPAEEIRKRLRSGELDAPPEIMATFQKRFTPVFRRSDQTRTDRAWSRFLTWLRIRPAPVMQTRDPELERILAYLEEQLEIKHVQ